MDLFELRNELIGGYRRYVAMRDRRIRVRVQSSLDDGRLWHRQTMGMGSV